MAITTFERYEKKYLLNEEQYKEISNTLTRYMKPDDYNFQGNAYTIYNLYFDTQGNDIIRHSLSKPYYKEKLRLRSYQVLNNDDETVFLELKKKIGGVVSKRRAVIPLGEAIDFVKTGNCPPCTGYMNKQVTKEIKHFLKVHNVEPKVYISYNRSAYFGLKDPDFRITFDKNITARRFDLDLKKDVYGDLLLPENQILMEIKTSAAFPLWLAKKLSKEKIFPSSFSKYGKEYKRFCSSHEAPEKITCKIPSYKYIRSSVKGTFLQGVNINA